AQRQQALHAALPPHAQADGGRRRAAAGDQQHLPGGRRRHLHRPGGGVGGAHGPQRVGQVDAAQAHQRGDAPGLRRAADPRSHRRAHRHRRRVPPAADRPRQRLPQRRDPGDERGGDEAEVRPDRRLRRHRPPPRQPGRQLLLRPVLAARFRSRGPHRLRHLPHRRGPRGRGQAVQEEVPGADGGDPPRGSDDVLRQPLRTVGAQDVRPRARSREGRPRLRRAGQGGDRLPPLRRVRRRRRGGRRRPRRPARRRHL
ncbi:MAG: Capsule polysaccharide export ATP-binding protein ctrD, partial [uncultured Nocardioidaceae bacterium]